MDNVISTERGRSEEKSVKGYGLKVKVKGFWAKGLKRDMRDRNAVT